MRAGGGGGGRARDRADLGAACAVLSQTCRSAQPCFARSVLPKINFCRSPSHPPSSLSPSAGGPTADDAYIREVTEAIRTRRSRIQDLISGASRPLAAVGSPTPRAGAASPRTGFGGSGALGGGGGMGGGGASVVSSSAPAINQDQLREVFEFYCNFGRSAIMTYQDSMDSFMFMKFARECPDLMDRRLNATGASSTAAAALVFGLSGGLCSGPARRGHESPLGRAVMGCCRSRGVRA